MADDLVQVLDADGNVTGEVPPLKDDRMLEMYELMVTTRMLDERMMQLQRQGRLGFYLTATGEEAAHVGSTLACRDTDWIVPQYREPGTFLARGMPLTSFVDQLFGNEEDLTKGRQMPNHFSYRDGNVLSVSSPVGSQIPHATGIGYAADYRGDDVASLVYFGDGATSQGEFHTGLNFAGVLETPSVFVCKNNGWAISLPFEEQTASETIAQKADAYGFPGVRVDGNDILAVYQVTKEAMDRARDGGGPTLIECRTYRLGSHSSSDDPSRYRDEEELEDWETRDPIERYRDFLAERGIWDNDVEEQVRQKIEDEIEAALDAAKDKPDPPLESMFDDVYEEMPPHLEEQQGELLDEAESSQ